MGKEQVFDSMRGSLILSELITEEQWDVCSGVIKAAQTKKLRFAIGGGLAYSAYTGNLRNTKDIDLFVMEEDHESLLAIMREERFEEYTEFPYDPQWSYRGHRDGYIVDVLWKMLNNRDEIDEAWITRGWEVDVRGNLLRLLPPEELLWSKLYVLYRERCDWPDILNIIYTQGPTMDWNHLLGRLQQDAPVLGSVMCLFRWMCPGRACKLPDFIWSEMELSPVKIDSGLLLDTKRAALFNSKDWFTKEVN